MKRIFTAAIVVAIALLFAAPGRALAAPSDTLVVYASGPSLDVIINSDTTVGGLQAHKVYKLVTVDTTYLYLAAASVKSNITVIGVLGANGRPPCIQPGLRQDNSLSTNIFNLNGAGTVGIFKNLYIFDLAPDNSYTDGTNDWWITADNVKLYVDNCIVEENRYQVFAFQGAHDDIFVTNCKFRNCVDPTNWFGSSIVACAYPSNTPADSIVVKYCTFLCVNSRAATTGNDGVVNYFEFSHNSYVYNFTEDLRMFSVVRGKFDDNIFYSLYAGAQPVSEYWFWFEVFSAETNSLVDFDTLTVAMDSTFDPADAGQANWRMMAEAKRVIEVKDNLYFWPKKLTDFWTAWDDTAHGGDSLYTAPWINNRTMNMLTDKTHWPNCSQSGNLNVDPGFGTSVANVIDNAGGTPGVVGLTSYVARIRSNGTARDIWGYQPNSVSGNNWVPPWPLPEQTSGALAYSASLTAPDGKPYGDPYWFTLSPTAVKQQSSAIPTKFDLSNNYPNPFNPSTTIKASLAKDGLMSLNVYNMLGQLVKVVDQGNKPAGEYLYTVNMDHFASGLYFYTLRQGNNVITKKMLLLK